MISYHYSITPEKLSQPRRFFSPQRPQSAQRKIFVFFVPFVVQFWLRPKPRYVLLSQNYHNREGFFHHKGHKAHKEKSLCSLCPLWCSFGCGQSRVTYYSRKTITTAKVLNCQLTILLVAARRHGSFALGLSNQYLYAHKQGFAAGEYGGGAKCDAAAIRADKIK